MSVSTKDAVASLNTAYRTVYWYLSMRCNLNCRHCWVSSTPFTDTSRDLSTQEALSVVGKIKELGAGVVLTGGEPLFRPDFREILTAIIESSTNIGIETNGLLIDSYFVEAVRRAKALGLTVNIAISLDGGTRESHEWMRGKNTFERTLESMRLLKDAGIDFSVQCILHKGNAHTITHLFEQMSSFAPQPRMLIFGFLNPLGRGLQLIDDRGLTSREKDQAYGLIVGGMTSYRGKVAVKTPPAMIPPAYLAKLFGHRQCTCGTSCAFPTLGVLANGTITVCALTSDNPSVCFGDIRANSLLEIWNKVHMDDVRREYLEANLKGICGDCIFRSYCKGSCRAHAYEEFGDFDAAHPLCDAMHRRGEFPDAYRVSRLDSSRVRVNESLYTIETSRPVA